MPKKLAALATLALLPLVAPAWAGPPTPSLFFPSTFPFPFPLPDPFPNPIPVLNPPTHRDPLPLPFPPGLPLPGPGSFQGAPAPLLAAGLPAFLALGAGGALARWLRRRRLPTAMDGTGA